MTPHHLKTACCLVALLAQLVLPLGHFAGYASGRHGVPSCSSARDCAPPIVAEGSHQHPHRAPHDCQSCPLCQAGGSAPAALLPGSALVALLSEESRKFLPEPPPPESCGFDLAAHPPRGPPALI